MIFMKNVSGETITPHVNVINVDVGARLTDYFIVSAVFEWSF